MSAIPFQTINWENVPKTEHKGEQGTSWWQVIEQDGIRIRIVEYAKGYLADHWCRKGHIVHCMEGEFITEMKNGEKTLLQKGQSYIVSDEMSEHKSFSADGVKLLIIDGDFLKN
ncbi:DHCW motif cupin fold protein [soil metagenome]